MGVPSKSWRAIMRPDRAWVSRGLLGIVCLMGFGGASTLVAWTGFLAPGSALAMLLKFAAGVAALVVMTYQGLAMSHSTAIALWNTGLMPVASLVYSATGGTLLTLLVGWPGFVETPPDSRPMLASAALLLVVVIGIVVASLLHGAHHGSPGGRKSVEVLTRTYYAKWFWGCIWLLGIALPILLLWTAGSSFGAVVLAAAGVLAGHYAFRVLMFKAGVYEPIMNFRF
jgi:formate-dependent nitrite reductase membrane component NrfD